MQKSVFRIGKMDCPSEEQLVRMAVADEPGIEALSFDLSRREVTVYHQGESARLLARLAPLALDTRLVQSGHADAPQREESQQRKLLWQVLAINFFFFLLEGAVGIWGRSMGLVADSLDMLADSLVYALALWAVGAVAARKKRVAYAAGYLQLLLAGWGLVEVVRRFIQPAYLPDFGAMMGISVLALIGNALCLYLLQKSRSEEAHMRASLIFTSNDVLVNLGVLLAGAAVILTQSRYPDLVVGAVVFVLVTRGAIQILRLAK